MVSTGGGVADGGVLGHAIDGRIGTAQAKRTLPVFNPVTGAETKRVAVATPGEVHEAIAAARAALPAWAATPPLVRARVLMRFRELMLRDLEALTAIVTDEHGKVLSDAKAEVMRGVEVVEFAMGMPQMLKSEHSPSGAGRGLDVTAARQPVGVCAGITPFNFPSMVPLWMIPVALACGNCFIHKPSEKVPSAALMLAELWAEAGLPPGVLNVVNGDKDVVDILLTDPRVDAISFVGSTPIAEYVFTTGTRHGKRVQALGGAKNHMVVMPDADLDRAVDGLIGAGYGSAGERCMAISVAVPVGPIAEPLVERLVERARALKVGPGTDPEAEMGPLVTAAHRDRVRSYVDLGIEEGADLLVDGRELRLQGYEDGFFFGPSLFDHVSTGMRIYKEEIFGPVLSVLRADSYEQALGYVNGHDFGNGVAVFTRDGGTARDFADRVTCGMVGVNVPIPVPPAHHSFGGWRRSLFGDHHIYGPEGVRFYTRLKTVTSRWPDADMSGAQFAMPTQA